MRRALGDPTFADAILPRLVHNAYKFKLKGGSTRKKQANLTQPAPSNPMITLPRRFALTGAQGLTGFSASASPELRIVENRNDLRLGELTFLYPEPCLALRVPEPLYLQSVVQSRKLTAASFLAAFEFRHSRERITRNRVGVRRRLSLPV